MTDVKVLLEFRMPEGSIWGPEARLVERTSKYGTHRVIQLRSDPEDYWSEHVSENADEVAAAVYDALRPKDGALPIYRNQLMEVFDRHIDGGRLAVSPATRDKILTDLGFEPE